MNRSPGFRWVREGLQRVGAFRVLKRVDDRPVWSIVCFFVGKRDRRQGLMVKLLQGAVGYAAEKAHRSSKAIRWTLATTGRWRLDRLHGLASAYRKAGYVEVARPNERRAIMRYFIGSATE